MPSGHHPARGSTAPGAWLPAARLRAAWSTIVALLVPLALLATLAGTISSAGPAAAGTDGPDWFPLKGTFAVWCTMSNPNCGHHSYMAMDIGKTAADALPVGTPVHASGPGVVAETGTGCPAVGSGGGDPCGGGRGNFVVIEHDDGRFSGYYHLQSPTVVAGARVGRGQQIGLSGGSGSSSAPHLHYEERGADGAIVDMGPMLALHDGAVVSYPGVLGFGSWYGAGGPPYGASVRNDGYQETSAARATAGDFDGDGIADRATYDRSTGVWSRPGQTDEVRGGAGSVPAPADYDGDTDIDVASYDLSSGTWSVPGAADVSLGGPGRYPVPGDYDGDGSAQRAVFEPGTGVWTVEGGAATPFGGIGTIPVPADYTGDGRTDLATYDPASGVWRVQGLTDVTMGGPGQLPVPADYDGDRVADRATYAPATGTWTVAGAGTTVAGGPGLLPVPADFTGDGKADRSTYDPSTGVWKVPGAADVVSGGPNRIPVAAAQPWELWRTITSEARATDANGDGRSDTGVFRPATGQWFLSGQSPFSFGAAGDVVFTGDIDGDGLTDSCIYRPSVGVWAVDAAGWWPFQLTTPVAGDLPLFADFRGDAKSHPAIFRPGTGEWFIEQDPPVVVVAPQAGDVPVAPDIDGDGVVDPGVFRPSTGQWFVQGGGPIDLGAAGDVPVVADLDGDERSDPIVFRPSTGEWLSAASGWTPVTYGLPGDIPLVVDLTGSGLGSISVYRPSTGEWYVRNGAVTELGAPGDVPVPPASGIAPVPLGQPGSVTATSAHKSALVSFAPPPVVGGGPAISYRVQASPGGSVVEVPASASSAVVPDLTTGASYSFTVTATSAAGYGAPSAPSAPVTITAPPLTGYHALTPFRTIDSRDGTATSGPLQAGEHRTVKVTGRGGVPGSGVTAVALNVTATNATERSFLTVWPTGGAQPEASSVNFAAGDTVPNLVVARVGAGGSIDLYNNSGSVQVIADVVGWFDDGTAGGADYAPTPSYRLLDSRDGTGISGPFEEGQARAITVTGTGGSTGVPATGVTAVVLNVTVVGATEASHLTVWPAGQPMPDVSSLNFVQGETVPNLVVATVGTDGRINIRNHAGSVQVLADVVGYFGNGPTGFVSLAPQRILDTRSSLGLAGPFGAAETRRVVVAGKGGLPPGGASAVVLNVTVTNPSATSFLTLWAGGRSFPGTSNLNYVADQVVANLVMVPVAPDGTIQIYNNSGSVEVIADVVGWYG